MKYFSLCLNSWGSASIYQRAKFHPDFSYRRLYLMLDEATLTFNGDPFEVKFISYRMSFVSQI